MHRRAPHSFEGVAGGMHIAGGWLHDSASLPGAVVRGVLAPAPPHSPPLFLVGGWSPRCAAMGLRSRQGAPTHRGKARLRSQPRGSGRGGTWGLPLQGCQAERGRGGLGRAGAPPA